LIVLMLAQLLFRFSLPWTSILLPLVLLPLIIACIGLTWFLAALGVYIRDIGQVTGVFTAMLMFISAVFYPVTILPEKYQAWLRLNPLVLIITESRNVLIFGTLPDWSALGIMLVLSLVVAAGGFWFFQKMRKGFADVL
jgi:lipopolysaccharide transport system permease protein